MIFVSGIGLTEKILNTAFNNFGRFQRLITILKCAVFDMLAICH